MAKFIYQARDNGGASLAGEIVASGEAEAAQLLRAEGKFVVRLDTADDSHSLAAHLPRKGSNRIKPDEVIYFANQLAGMVETGVPLADALEATIEQAPPGAFRRTIEDIIARVQGGTDLSAALAAHPKVFSPLFVHMVRASEKTGTLGPMLSRIADYLVNQREIRKKVKGALTYPCCMMVFAVGAMIFLLTFVLPKFAAIYAGKAAALPLPTRILMNTSEWMVGQWYFLVGGTILAAVAAHLYFRTERGKYTSDWLRLHMPVVGGMFQQACVTRALRTLGSMISAGVSVLEAVPITRDVVGNRLFGRIFDDACRRMESGDQLSAALLNAPYIPRNVWQMLRAGERTGKLGPTMDRIAELCEADLRNSIRTITQFIEPAMIAFLGIMIGGIAIAVLMPIFQISKIMAH
ncbi:MAG: type II secretion system F family protein [Phycisphaerae bacterium]|nr:type II secretion system F family protein [Phycisphaerae bacterium]